MKAITRPALLIVISSSANAEAIKLRGTRNFNSERLS